jgi:hypothetical protein
LVNIFILLNYHTRYFFYPNWCIYPQKKNLGEPLRAPLARSRRAIRSITRAAFISFTHRGWFRFYPSRIAGFARLVASIAASRLW